MDDPCASNTLESRPAPGVMQRAKLRDNGGILFDGANALGTS